MKEQTLITWFTKRKITRTVPLLFKIIIIVTLAWAFGWWLVPFIIRLVISSKLKISPDLSPEFYAAWEKPPMPIFLTAHLFNVTNPEEIQAGGLPKFAEVGPYVFQGKRWRLNISFDDATDTATYMDHAHFSFNKNMSGNRNLNDVITLINVPFAAAAIQIQRDFPWPLRDLAHVILKNHEEPLFIQKTVEYVLFKGWKVPFLEKIEEEVGLTMIENNTFSFLMGINDTNHGPTTIKRGIRGDANHFGNVIKFKGESTLNYWGERDSTCNRIQGTDGTIFPPFIGKDTVLRVFNAELCRSFYLTYHKDTVFEGIHGYRFMAPGTVTEDPRLLEENRCFCESVDSEPGKCLGRGALDMGPCRNGAPVATSAPHFLDAIPEYLEQIYEGVKPDRSLHETFIDVEPLTGVVLEGRKKVQVNLILKRVPSIPSLRKVNEMLFPLLWVEESGKLGPDELKLFKFYLSLRLVADYGSKFAASVLAAVTIVALKRQQLLHSSKETLEKADKETDSDDAGSMFLE